MGGRSGTVVRRGVVRDGGVRGTLVDKGLGVVARCGGARELRTGVLVPLAAYAGASLRVGTEVVRSAAPQCTLRVLLRCCTLWCLAVFTGIN